MTDNRLDRGSVLEMAAGFMPSCVLGAMAELDVFSMLGEGSMSIEEVADALRLDLRGGRILLDAAAALRLLDKQDGRYAVPDALRPLLTEQSPESVLPMVRHRMNILRQWAQLAWIAKSGIPWPRQASIRGSEADRAAFVAAMHTASGPMADDLIARLGPLRMTHLLDVGGASGTWTLAFLRAYPSATATLFDLPDAIEQARRRISSTDLADRIRLVAGDFYVDDLPGGADFAWLSAIVHQHSRSQNRELLKKIFAALRSDGWVAIRDVVMQPCRTRPVDGALFAVNMLVNTDTGGTFTFDELSDDLRAAGFVAPELRLQGDMMDSVVMARRPEAGAAS